MVYIYIYIFFFSFLVLPWGGDFPSGISFKSLGFGPLCATFLGLMQGTEVLICTQKIVHEC
jgi:hypothetical protein